MHTKHTKHGKFCKQNNQLPIKTHVELEDNSNVSNLTTTREQGGRAPTISSKMSRETSLLVTDAPVELEKWLFEAPGFGKP